MFDKKLDTKESQSNKNTHYNLCCLETVFTIGNNLQVQSKIPVRSLRFLCTEIGNNMKPQKT